MTTQHFLVPIDFSDYANEALDYAITLAKKLQARVTLVHVIQAMALGVADGGAALPYTYLEELETDVTQNLEQYLQRVKDAGLEGDTVVVHGVPFQSVVDLAQDKNVDLIIMGTHGRTGLKHVLLGSVAEKVVRLAPCPVLVTRNTQTATDA